LELPSTLKSSSTAYFFQASKKLEIQKNITKVFCVILFLKSIQIDIPKEFQVLISLEFEKNN